MKNLIVIRHGKSSWKYDLPDDKRPLKTRGIADANLVSKNFKPRDIHPDLVLSSPAVRAFSTCEIFCENLGIPVENVQIINDLYDFQGDSVVETLKNLRENYDTVMIFGHNHAFTSICNIFGNKFIDNLPTSGLVLLKFDIDSWADLIKGETELTIFPKDLK